MYEQLPSGIIVPTEPPKVDPHEAERQYQALHQCCPTCGSDSIWRTCLGMILPSEDTNTARCECGWIGIVHDLLPK